MRFMLAERGTEGDLERLQAAGYVFDLKIDGIRALVSIGDPTLDARPALDAGLLFTMTSRNGLDLTGRYPELAEALAELASGGSRGVTLDAEIAVPGRDGLPSWPLTHRRTAQRSAAGRLSGQVPAHLYVFDVLQLDGHDTTRLPLRERRAALEQLAVGWPVRLSVTPYSADFRPLWDLVVEQRLEGLIAKNPESRYRAGRSRDWVKVKATSTLSCLVGGVQWAPGSTDEPRSLQLFLVDDAGELVQCGKASAGVTPALRRALLEGLRRPPLIVEVEYSQITDVGVLRHPVVRDVRRDLDVLDCSTDQLKGH
jgi:bifunctional non-homologous end joining protein LigD